MIPGKFIFVGVGLLVGHFVCLTSLPLIWGGGGGSTSECCVNATTDYHFAENCWEDKKFSGYNYPRLA
jgi:hypothetical protein